MTRQTAWDENLRNLSEKVCKKMGEILRGLPNNIPVEVVRLEYLYLREGYMTSIVIRDLKYSEFYDTCLQVGSYHTSCAGNIKGYMHVGYNDSEDSLDSHFQNFLEPTEVELEEYFLSKGYHYILSEQGVIDIVEMNQKIDPSKVTKIILNSFRFRGE